MRAWIVLQGSWGWQWRSARAPVAAYARHLPVFQSGDVTLVRLSRVDVVVGGPVNVGLTGVAVVTVDEAALTVPTR